MKNRLSALVLACLFLLPSISHATVVASTSRIQASCNGSTTQFPFIFNNEATSDVKVIKTDAQGGETTLVNGTDYTVACTNNDCSAGGTVTVLDTCATGYAITILRDVNVTQGTEYTDGMPGLYETLEADLDKQIRIAQQQQEQLARAPKLPESSTLSDLDLPNPTGGYAIGWNASGDGLANISSTALTVTQKDYVHSDETFAQAVTRIGSTPTTLLIDGLEDGAGVTVPSTLALEFTRGGSLGGIGTVTINGPIVAGNWQIFGDNLTVTGVTAPNVAWVGADLTGVSDSFAAFKAAVDFNVPVFVPAGEYYIDTDTNGTLDTASSNVPIRLFADPDDLPTIKFKNTGANPSLRIKAVSGFRGTLRNLKLVSYQDAGTTFNYSASGGNNGHTVSVDSGNREILVQIGNQAGQTGGADRVLLDSVTISNCSGAAIEAYDTNGLILSRCKINSNLKGLLFQNNVWANHQNWTVDTCTMTGNESAISNKKWEGTWGDGVGPGLIVGSTLQGNVYPVYLKQEPADPTKHSQDIYFVANWIEDNEQPPEIEGTGTATRNRAVPMGFSDATCDTTNADATVTMDSTANLVVGMSVSGSGIPASTTVLSITDATTFELSQNATATATDVTLTFGGLTQDVTFTNPTDLNNYVSEQSQDTQFEWVAASALRLLRFHGGGTWSSGDYTQSGDPGGDSSNNYGFTYSVATGAMEMASNAATVLAFNRQNSSGNVVEYRYEGTQIGAVTTADGVTYESSGSSDLTLKSATAKIRMDGYFQFTSAAQITTSAAPNNSLFINSATGVLTFKDGSAVSHALY